MQRRTPTDPQLAAAPWARLHEAPLPPVIVVDGLATRSGAVYSSIPGYRPLELDLYAPAEAWSAVGAHARAHPAVVWIHGGAFRLGSRRVLPDFLQAAGFFRRITDAGFIVAAIDYRLSAEAHWPAQIVDVRDALRFLGTRADELAIDSTAISVWGESAGGHLAAMAGVLPGEALSGERESPLPRVAAVVDWYGPTNFAAMDRQAPADSVMSHDDPDSPESQLLGAPVQEVPARVAAADPAHYARAGLPPILIRHGRADRLVPFGQSELFAAALERVASPVRFLPVDDAGHVFEGDPDPARFIDEALGFLRETVANPGKG